MTDEQGVTRSAGHHRDDRDPRFADALRRILAVTDAEHVGHGLEESPRVLLKPRLPLQGERRARNQHSCNVYPS